MFDPLGLGLRAVDKLTHSSNTLFKLLSKAHVTQNTTKFQQLESDVQSCGRHCATRWNLCHFKPDEYRRALSLRTLSYDDTVTMLTISRDLTKWKPD